MKANPTFIRHLNKTGENAELDNFEKDVAFIGARF